MPAKIIQVPDIPRTKSGKITEIAVRDLVHGREIKNAEALANPEALDYYRGLDRTLRSHCDATASSDADEIDPN